MAITSLGGMPLVPIGLGGSNLGAYLNGYTNVTIDAANEACSFIGQLFWEDGGSHTVDTTGSSSLQWRSSTVTFANAGTTFLVGLAAVDTATGSAAPRAVNSSDVITMDVYASFTGGGGGVTASAWQTSVPTSGTKTIAHGDLIAMSFQMTARGGADTIQVSYANHNSGNFSQRPTVGTFVGAAYAAGGGVPNAVVVASDGTLGFFFGGSVYSLTAGTAFNSGSTPNERGNVIIPPVPGRAHGFVYNTSLAGSSSDFDLVLYSDPLGTPSAQKTVSIDANTMGVNTSNNFGVALFASPYTFTASQPLAAIYKPTTGNNITPIYLTLGNSAHQKAMSLGAGAYAVNRSSGAFAAQNSSLDRYGIGLLIEAFDNGVGGGVVGVIGG